MCVPVCGAVLCCAQHRTAPEGTLPEDGNVMPKRVEATIHN
jgi:hypothetical protein